MSTRIKYLKDGQRLYSRDSYRIRSGLYAININLDDMTYVIMRNGCTEYFKGTATTINQLKIKAKKVLIELGVGFRSEVRSSKNKQPIDEILDKANEQT